MRFLLPIGGCTLHSFMGLGLATEAVPVLKAKIHRNKAAVHRIRQTQCLVVVDGDTLDKFDLVLQHVTGVELPMGGIQVVFFGDFLLLPDQVKKER